MPLKTTPPLIDSFHAERLPQRAVLFGRAQYVSLHRNDAPEGFVFYASRDTSRSIWASLGKAGQKVHIFVDEQVLSSQKSRFATAADGYISWGLMRSAGETLVLFGGGEGADETTLQVLVFQDGKLLQAADKRLPARDSMLFESTLATMLQEWRQLYPSARFVQAAPLTAWGIDDIEFVGDAPLARLSFRRVELAGARENTWLAPALTVTGIAVACAGAMYVTYSGYADAQGAYDSVLADPLVKQVGGIDVTMLDRIRARQAYMEAQRPQRQHFEVASQVAKSLGQLEGLRIVELAVPAASLSMLREESQRRDEGKEGKRHPDFRAQISMPRSPALAGLVQAQELLSRLSGMTGMTLRLAHQGLREDATTRTFTIEGFVADAAAQAEKGPAK